MSTSQLIVCKSLNFMMLIIVYMSIYCLQTIGCLCYIVCDVLWCNVMYGCDLLWDYSCVNYKCCGKRMEQSLTEAMASSITNYRTMLDTCIHNLIDKIILWGLIPDSTRSHNKRVNPGLIFTLPNACIS